MIVIIPESGSRWFTVGPPACQARSIIDSPLACRCFKSGSRKAYGWPVIVPALAHSRFETGAWSFYASPFIGSQRDHHCTDVRSWKAHGGFAMISPLIHCRPVPVSGSFRARLIGGPRLVRTRFSFGPSMDHRRVAVVPRLAAGRFTLGPLPFRRWLNPGLSC